MNGMKPFRYSMENILSYRQDIEQTEKQKFAELKNEYLKQRKVQEDLEEKLDKAASSKLNNPSSSIVDLKNLYQYMLFLQKKMEVQQQLVMEAGNRMESQRQRLIEAQKDRKIIEKHKDRCLERYTQELNRTEQQVNDELALYSHMRK